MQVGINGSRSGSVVVPVGSDGYVSLTTSAGATDVVASVTGYVAAVPQPTTTTPTPTTPPAPSPTSPAPPATTLPSGVARWPGVPLRLGMRGPSVISLQKGLLARGYGIPTLAVAKPRFGTYDAATKAAVARWQRRHARYGAADGVVRAAVYAALTAPVPAAPPAVTPVSTTPAPSPAGVAPWPGVSLRQGMRGPSIASWQRALIARGYRIATLAAAGAVFGTFDAATHAATVAFQRATPALGAPDGVVGPRTYAYLTAFRA